jgi:5-methylcytosine-specific restriction protein A
VIKNLKDVPKNLEEYGFKELKKYINKQGANGRIYLFKDEDRGNKLYSLIMGSDLPTTHSDKTPREKKPLININGKEEYPRDENIKNHALEDANYQCELDESHISFISQKTTKNYVEGHHLIPVNQHSKFKYDLDVSENIISLCPECHRMLHHAEKRQIRSGLSKLLEQRSDALKEVGLDISLDELVEVY